jgi:uncharacterized RDD family membrane protein YckC
LKRAAIEVRVCLIIVDIAGSFEGSRSLRKPLCDPRVNNIRVVILVAIVVAIAFAVAVIVIAIAIAGCPFYSQDTTMYLYIIMIMTVSMGWRYAFMMEYVLSDGNRVRWKELE